MYVAFVVPYDATIINLNEIFITAKWGVQLNGN